MDAALADEPAEGVRPVSADAVAVNRAGYDEGRTARKLNGLVMLVRRVGLEPTTRGLRVRCSAS